MDIGVVSQSAIEHGGKRLLSRQQKRIHLFCYLFLLPQTVMYLAFTIWPILASYYYSFFNWDGVGWPTDFIGFQNYQGVISDPFFWGAFQNSFLYTIATVILVVPGALIMALILNNRKLKGVIVFRTLIFLPVVLTMAVVGLVMQDMFGYNGFFNRLLMWIGLLHQPVEWLNSAIIAMVLLILIGSWKGFGIKVIYWLAGLQTVSTEIYEAAHVDGANVIQRFRHITVPMLIPFLIVITILQTNESFHVFDLVRTFTNGGPFFGTDVVPLYIYNNAFGSLVPRMGYACAAGIVFGIATLLVSLGLGLLARRFGQRNTL